MDIEELPDVANAMRIEDPTLTLNRLKAMKRKATGSKMIGLVLYYAGGLLLWLIYKHLLSGWFGSVIGWIAIATGPLLWPIILKVTIGTISTGCWVLFCISFFGGLLYRIRGTFIANKRNGMETEEKLKLVRKYYGYNITDEALTNLMDTSFERWLEIDKLARE